MSAGIFTVAYGSDYDRCAAHAMLYSRRFTDLPIAVATNIRPECRSKAWSKVGDVRFFYFERDQRDNRRAKLQMDLISPFERTLYMDADCVIQHPGVEAFIPLLDNADMVFNWRITVRPGDRVWNIYARCMKMFGVCKPIDIHNGGLIAFKKTEEVRKFFELWLSMWERFGAGREMPPLNCAIKRSGIHHETFPLMYFADDQRTDSAIIQHNYNRDFDQRFGIPKWTEYKPFDSGHKDDFRKETVPCP